MRRVDLSKLDFDGDKVQSIPLDLVRAEDVQDRTKNL